MTNINIEDINEEDIIKLFTNFDIIVSSVDIDRDDNSVNAYIEITSTNTYTIDWIENIIKKLKTIQDELIKEGLIEDMSLGDIYKGVLRVSINFKTTEDAVSGDGKIDDAAQAVLIALQYLSAKGKVIFAREVNKINRTDDDTWEVEIQSPKFTGTVKILNGEPEIVNESRHM